MVRGLKTVGPYVAVELLLPGGTLIAFTMWLLARARARKEVKRLSLGPR